VRQPQRRNDGIAPTLLRCTIHEADRRFISDFAVRRALHRAIAANDLFRWRRCPYAPIFLKNAAPMEGRAAGLMGIDKANHRPG
jgi:hypothetical protein